MFKFDSEKANKLAKSFYIPAKPEVLDSLNKEQSKEDPNVSVIAKLIASDVGLSAQILKAINSPAYGLSRTVTDIKQSVLMLGVQNVVTLVSFFELRRSLSGKASISLERFWDTAVETAELMSLLLGRLDLKRQCPIEDVYSFGLFHDCGVALMAMRYENYREVLEEANGTTQDLAVLEGQHYETNHTIIGYYMATSWHLPKSLCSVILQHHDNDALVSHSLTESSKDLIGLLWMAENLQNKYRRHEEHSQWTLHKEEVWYYFGLSESDYQELEADVLDDFNVLD